MRTQLVKNRMLRGFSWLAILSIPLGILAPSCRGQNLNAGEIKGTVIDTAGAALPGVAVDALNIKTGIHVRGVSGTTGVFDLPYVPAGSYTVIFSKEGFETFRQTQVLVHVETITVNATLKVGQVSTQVTVTGQPELLQPETSDLSTSISAESISELPNVGNLWLDYTELVPGDVPVATPSTNTQIGEYAMINGAQQFQSAWLFDGSVANLPVSYNPDGLVAPLGSIQELDITTSNAGSESGNGLSSYNVITKSGTNRFHGSLYEFVQNDIFNAAPRNWSSSPQAKPAIRWNEYGGALGGPIVRNRLFFFFNYQANPIRTYQSGLYTFPTTDMRAGNFSNPSFSPIFNPATTTQTNGIYTRQPFANNEITTPIDPVAAKIQPFFPVPNAINPASPYYNNYYFAAPNPSTEHWYDYKVDGDLSPTNRLDTSGLFTLQNAVSPSPDCPIDCYTGTTNELAAQLTDVWTISTTKMNEFRMGLAREYNRDSPNADNKGYPAEIGLPQLPLNAFPNINISTGPGISIGGNAIITRIGENSIAATDTFNWILGKHTLKMGGEYDDWRENQEFAGMNSGSFNFDGIDTRDPNVNNPNASPGVGYADFLLGGVQSWSFQQPAEYGGRDSNVQLYAEDYYKIRPNLTLNFGMRFIYQGGWSEEHNRIGNYDPTLLNPGTGTLGAIGYLGVQLPKHLEAPVPFFAPRGGFAWTPLPSWVVRGGFGLYQIPWSAQAYIDNIVGTGFTISGSAQSTDNITPIFQLVNGPPPPIYSTPANRTPELLNGQSIYYYPYHTPMSYFEQYQLGIQHQMGAYLVTATYVGSRGVNMPFSTDINQVVNLGSGIRPNPTYQSINATQYDGWSNYNALQLTAKRRFTNGFSFTANYTWSKSMDTGTAIGGNGPGLDNWQYAYSPAANYSASNNDIRQLFTGMGLYQLPFGRHRKYANSNTLADLVIGGWQVATVFNVHSGWPFTPTMVNNLSGALSGSWYPNQIGSGRLAHPSINEWFNVNAFVSPAPNTFGDTKRNTLDSPNYTDIDLSVAKVFPVPIAGNSTTFEFKADSFDIFNHPNYQFPNAAIGSAGVGVISSNYTNRTLQLGGMLRF
ncbi:MAG: carboxypeptidase regulatory-like domain-containing protein [Acidobacteriaceae bacterium]